MLIMLASQSLKTAKHESKVTLTQNSSWEKATSGGPGLVGFYSMWGHWFVEFGHTGQRWVLQPEQQQCWSPGKTNQQKKVTSASFFGSRNFMARRINSAEPTWSCSVLPRYVHQGTNPGRGWWETRAKRHRIRSTHWVCAGPLTELSHHVSSTEGTILILQDVSGSLGKKKPHTTN